MPSTHESLLPDAQPSTDRNRLPRPVKITAAVLFATWCVDYIDRSILSISLPHIVEDFSLSATAAGALLSVFGVAYTLAHIPAGMLADRMGSRRLIAFAMIAWSVFTAVCGLAWNYASLFVTRLLFGAAQAAFPPASMKRICEVTTPRQRMTVNGIVGSSNAVGGMLAALLLPVMVAMLGWRATFIAVAAIGLVLLLVVLRWLPPIKSTAEPRTSASPRAKNGTLGLVLSSPWLYLYALMYFGIGLVSWGVLSWMPTYLTTVRGVDVGGVSLLLALPLVLSAIGAMLGGRLTDRLDGRSRLIVTPAMILGFAALVVMSLASALTLFIAAECVAMFMIGVSMTSVFSVPMKSVLPQFSGTTSALINMGSQVASIVAPLLMGVLVDVWGFTAAFLAMAVGAAITAIAAAIVPQSPREFVRRSPSSAALFAQATA